MSRTAASTVAARSERHTSRSGRYGIGPVVDAAANRRGASSGSRRRSRRRPARPSPTRTARRCARTRRRRPARRPSPWRRPSRAARARRRAPRRGTRRPPAAACATRAAASSRSGAAGAGGGCAVDEQLVLRRAARLPRHAGTPLNASATCTAQSVRPSPHSRVPSSGSTIHTRSRASRAGESLDSSDSTASSGRALGQAGEDQLVAEPVAFVLGRLSAPGARAAARRPRARCRLRARDRPLS